MYEKIDKDINPDIIINKNKDEGKVIISSNMTVEDWGTTTAPTSTPEWSRA